MYYETDGWRDVNGARNSNGALYGKWDFTPKDGVMAVLSGQKSKEFGAPYPRFEWDSVPEPGDWSENMRQRFEVGYYRHFSPRSDLLVHLTRVEGKTDIQDSSNFTQPVNLPPPAIARGKSLLAAASRQPYYQAQGQYFHKFGSHQLRWGAVFYLGDNSLEGKSSGEITEIEIAGMKTPVLIPLPELPINNATQRRLQSYYLQDTWKLSSSLRIEGALYFDRIENGDPVFGTEWTRNNWNPRLALIVTPTARDTIRLAVFRYRLPFLASRIDPMDIGGIPVFRNFKEGSLVEEANLTMEREWSSGFASLSIFALHQMDDGLIRINNVDTERAQSGRQEGFDATINQLMGRFFGLSATYNFRDIEDDALPQADREDHLLAGTLTHVYRLGISASIRESYRHTRFKSTERTDESIWITDLSLQYEWPGKKGAIRFVINNLFDRHFNWVTGFYDLTGRVPAREILLNVSVYF